MNELDLLILRASNASVDRLRYMAELKSNQHDPVFIDHAIMRLKSFVPSFNELTKRIGIIVPMFYF